MKFVPIGVMAVSLIAGFVTLKNDVANAKDRIEKIEVSQNVLSKDSSEIKISQARVETRLDLINEQTKAIYQAIKELKK